MVGPVAVLVEGAAEHVVFVADGRGRVVVAAVEAVAVGSVAVGDIVCVHAFTVARFGRVRRLNK